MLKQGVARTLGSALLLAVAAARGAGGAPSDPVALVGRLGSDDFAVREKAKTGLAEACARLEKEGKRKELKRLAEALEQAAKSGDPEVAAAAHGILAPLRAGAPLSLIPPGTLPYHSPEQRLSVPGSLLFSDPFCFNNSKNPMVAACVDRETAKLLWSRAESDLPGSLASFLRTEEGIFLAGCNPHGKGKGAGWIQRLDPASGEVRWSSAAGELPGDILRLKKVPGGILAWGMGAKGEWLALLDPRTGRTVWTTPEAEPPPDGATFRSSGGDGAGYHNVQVGGKDSRTAAYCQPVEIDGVLLTCGWNRRIDPKDGKPVGQSSAWTRAYEASSGKLLWRREAKGSILWHSIQEGRKGELILSGGDGFQIIRRSDGEILSEIRPEKKEDGEEMPRGSLIPLGEGYLRIRKHPDGGTSAALFVPPERKPRWERVVAGNGWLATTPTSGGMLLWSSPAGQKPFCFLPDLETGKSRWELSGDWTHGPSLLAPGVLVWREEEKTSAVMLLDPSDGKPRWERAAQLPPGLKHANVAAGGGALLLSGDGAEGAWIALLEGKDGAVRWTASLPRWKDDLSSLPAPRILPESVVWAWQGRDDAEGHARVFDLATGRPVASLDGLPGSLSACEIRGERILCAGTGTTRNIQGHGAWVGLYRLRDAWEERSFHSIASE